MNTLARFATSHGKRVAVETLKAAPKRRKRFTKFPGIWEEVLGKAHASGSTYAVAIILVYEAWRLTSRNHKPVVKLTSLMLKRGYVGKRGKHNALHKLERLGLVTVEWRRNRNPLVTVLH